MPSARTALGFVLTGLLAGGLGGCRSRVTSCCPAPAPASVAMPEAWTTTEHQLRRSTAREPKKRRSLRDLFSDDKDRDVDASDFMSMPGGFLPAIIPITDPAVGLGAVGIAAFFHRGKDEGKRGPSGQRIPPSVTAVGGLGTSNGSWGALAGHLGSANGDRIRYAGGVFYGSFNLDYYGVVSNVVGRPRSFNIEGAGVIADVQFRLGNTPLFAGLRYQYFSNRVEASRLIGLPGLKPIEFDSENAGLGIEVTLDTRDNIFTPNRGYRAQALFTFFDPAFGGDFDYRRVDVYGLGWWPLGCKWTLAGRLDGSFVQGDAPFYGKPFVNLRGIPALRYLGDNTLVAESEVRYDFTQRWSAIGFGGVGRVGNSVGGLLGNDERDVVQTVWNAGTGCRYLVARKYGIRMGLDVARGPEEWAFYVTIGNAWLRL